MCNLYSITTNEPAIAGLSASATAMSATSHRCRACSRLSGSGGPQLGRRTRNDDDALRMPPPPRAGGYPVTNIRNTSSPHWRAWLSAENRCLVPANSFAEYAPEPNPKTGKKDVAGSRSAKTGLCSPSGHLDDLQR